MYWDKIYFHFTFIFLLFNPVSEKITHLTFIFLLFNPVSEKITHLFAGGCAW